MWNVVGTAHYVRETMHGRTKPNRVTWLLWAIASFIATAAALAQGITWSVLPVFMAGFTPLLVLAASFVNPHAYWKLGIFDYFCGLCSLLALVLWVITKEPAIAILFAILSDILASTPTIVKTWHHPDTESGMTYLGGLVSAITGLLVVQAWFFSAYAFLALSVITNSLLLFLIYRRKFSSSY